MTVCLDKLQCFKHGKREKKLAVHGSSKMVVKFIIVIFNILPFATVQTLFCWTGFFLGGASIMMISHGYICSLTALFDEISMLPSF